MLKRGSTEAFVAEEGLNAWVKVSIAGVGTEFNLLLRICITKTGHITKCALRWATLFDFGAKHKQLGFTWTQ